MNVNLKNQKGAVLPLMTIAMVVFFAMSGLALDLGHLYVEKTKLQNILDGAAIRGAYILNLTSDQVQARNAAIDTFNRSLAAPGNSELATLVNSANIAFQFPVINSPAGVTTLIKLTYPQLTINTTFTRVLGIDTLDVGSTAVAGAIPLGTEVCNVVPIIMCGDSTQAPSSTNPDAFYGYRVGDYVNMKMTQWQNNQIGPGNFGLLNLTETGGAGVRENMAGGGACVNLGVSKPIDTQPGNVAGPTSQGINTRFGEYQSGLSRSDYPPDWVTTSSESYTYSQYQSDYANINVNSPPPGKPNRRILTVPIGDCSGVSKAGATTVPVLAFGCFFIREKLPSNNIEVKGEFIGGCAAEGAIGQGNFGRGPYKIVLYRDTNSPDS